MIDTTEDAGYAEIYQAYIRALPRKTERDIETMKNVAHLIDLEGITLLQLRQRAYAHIHRKSKPLALKVGNPS